MVRTAPRVPPSLYHVHRREPSCTFPPRKYCDRTICGYPMGTVHGSGLPSQRVVTSGPTFLALASVRSYGGHLVPSKTKPMHGYAVLYNGTIRTIDVQYCPLAVVTVRNPSDRKAILNFENVLTPSLRKSRGASYAQADEAANESYFGLA